MICKQWISSRLNTLLAGVLVLTMLLTTIPANLALANSANEILFNHTGGVQQWVVPDGVNSIEVDVRGAQGGTAANYYTSPGGPGGPGGRLETTLSVTPGETLYIYVGGVGSGGTGGYNGGGSGGYGGGMGGYGGGGGGASDIRQGGNALSNRIAVAGGGGGGKGYYDSAVDGPYGGGLGGGVIGGDGPDHFTAAYGGKGGTQSSGGDGGSKGVSTYGRAGYPGGFGLGGDGGPYYASGVGGGGGGGGYYGGGGGASDGAGGGGGSSYSIGMNTIHTQGYQPGDGLVIIEYGGNQPSLKDWEYLDSIPSSFHSILDLIGVYQVQIAGEFEAEFNYPETVDEAWIELDLKYFMATDPLQERISETRTIPLSRLIDHSFICDIELGTWTPLGPLDWISVLAILYGGPGPITYGPPTIAIGIERVYVSAEITKVKGLTTAGDSFEFPIGEIIETLFQRARGVWDDQVVATMACPADMLIELSDGKRLGSDGVVTYMEIEGGYYFNDPQNDIRVIGLPIPSQGYSIQAWAFEDGYYDLEIGLIEQGMYGQNFSAHNIHTSANAVHLYSIDWHALSEGEEGVIVQIDSDGDGTFECTITSDSELTSDEFILQTETVVDFDPDTLNLRNRGKAVTVYIELPPGYDASQIDISSIRLNDTLPALARPTAIGDYDRDGIPDLMIKFDRAAVKSLLTPSNQVEITITGEVAGVAFESTDIIRVINP